MFHSRRHLRRFGQGAQSTQQSLGFVERKLFYDLEVGRALGHPERSQPSYRGLELGHGLIRKDPLASQVLPPQDNQLPPLTHAGSQAGHAVAPITHGDLESDAARAWLDDMAGLLPPFEE